MAEVHRTQTWRLRGTLDLQCAACRHVGAELRVVLVVEGWVSDDGSMGTRLVDGDRPIEIECGSCGKVTKYGDAMEAVGRAE